MEGCDQKARCELQEWLSCAQPYDSTTLVLGYALTELLGEVETGGTNPEPPPEHKCKHGTIDCEQYIYVAIMDLIKALVVADTTARPTYIAPDADPSSKIRLRSNIFLGILQMIIAFNTKTDVTLAHILCCEQH